MCDISKIDFYGKTKSEIPISDFNIRKINEGTMPFSNEVRIDALTKSRRCCCVCHKFCGRDINVHHIIQEANGGPNTTENAIPLCMECHSEAGHYSPGHPLGTKYSPKELKIHRENWLKWCESNQEKMLPDYPIGIAPTRLILNSGKWKKEGLVRIFNRTDEPVNSIYAAILSDGIDSPQTNLIVEQISSKQFPIMKIPSADIYGDCMGLSGALPDGRAIMLLMIQSMDPKENLSFSARVDLGGEHKDYKFNCTILDINGETMSIQNNEEESKAAFLWEPPINFNVRGIGYRIKKIK
jgi:hypothetical protein